MSDNKIYIDCGIKVGAQNKSEKLYWSVLQAKQLPLTEESLRRFKLQTNQPFSLIFTSNTAVKLFPQEFMNELLNSTQLNQLEHICAVGGSTAKAIEKDMMPLLKTHYKNKIIFYPSQEGLFYLLKNTPLKEQSSVCIFTAENGQTQPILEFFQPDELKARFIVFPLYKIEKNKTTFLDNLFKKPIAENNHYVFCCRSGMVLKAVLEQLQDYFSCSEASQLPAFISFSAEKKSTLLAIQLNNLIDRTSS